VSRKLRFVDTSGGRKDLEAELLEVTSSLQVRRAREGEPMACSLCGRTVSFTYRTVCGECFLSGRVGRTS
jgi:hypothetical protein